MLVCEWQELEAMNDLISDMLGRRHNIQEREHLDWVDSLEQGACPAAKPVTRAQRALRLRRLALLTRRS